MSYRTIRHRVAAVLAATISILPVLPQPAAQAALPCTLPSMQAQFQAISAVDDVYMLYVWADAPGCLAGGAYGIATPNNLNGTRGQCLSRDPRVTTDQHLLFCATAVPAFEPGTVVITGPVDYTLTGEFYASGRPEQLPAHLTYACTVSITTPGAFSYPFDCSYSSS